MSKWYNSCDVVAIELDWGFEVSEFKHLASFYVPLRINTIGKGMKPLIQTDGWLTTKQRNETNQWNM